MRARKAGTFSTGTAHTLPRGSALTDCVGACPVNPFALIRSGLTSTPYGTVLQNWMRACYNRAQDCQTGALALKPYTIGIATTDATGHAQTPLLPTGRYWVLSDAKVDNRHMMWNQPVDVKGANASVTLDRGNAMPVE